MTTYNEAATVVLLHAHYDEDHLEAVVAEMETLGTPEIRCVRDGAGVWYALEGCHRLRAAEILGLTPELVEMEWTADDLETPLDTLYGDVFGLQDGDSITLDTVFGNTRTHVIDFPGDE